MPASDLVKVQLGQEVAWGTGVAATAKLMGVTAASMSIVQTVHQTEKSGFMYPAPYAVQTSYSSEGSIDMDLSYQDIIYPLQGFFDEDAAPVGTADPYTWTWVAPTTAVTTPQPFTIEMGPPDATYGWEATGCYFTGLTISGEAGGVWTGSFPFIGESIDDGTMTVLTDHVVELIRMADTQIHLDTWGTAAGTAAASAATLISFELSVQNGRHLKQFAGSLQPEDTGETQWSGTLTTVLEMNAVSLALLTALATPVVTQRAIEIEATSGAHIATIDFYGTLADAVEVIGPDRDGNTIVELVWNGTYEPTAADWLEINVLNTMATMT